jgi:hypothetical protein
LTFSHNGKLSGQISKIGIPKHTLAEKVDRASYTLLGIKLSSSFFFLRVLGAFAVQ